MPKNTAKKYTAEALKIVIQRLETYMRDINKVAEAMIESKVPEITVKFAGELERANKAIKNFASSADDGLYIALEEMQRLGTNVTEGG